MSNNLDLNSNRDNKKNLIEKLVKRAQFGDMNAFAGIYDYYVDRIYKYFYFKTSNEEAFDLTENLFLSVWDNLSMYKPRKDSSFSAWIFRIAHNALVDYYRVKKDVLPLDERHSDQRRENSPVIFAERNLSKTCLKTALSRLKDKYREVITLSYISGFSNEEIARILNKNDGNLRVLKFRALRELKKILEEMGIVY